MSISKFLPGIAWFLFGLILICLPGKDVPKHDFLDFVNIDKFAHAGIFGGLVFLFCRPFRNHSMPEEQKSGIFTKIMLATCVWGITTELIQKYFIPGRQFDLLDWAADCVGAVVAYWVSRRYFLRQSTS